MSQFELNFLSKMSQVSVEILVQDESKVGGNFGPGVQELVENLV